MPRRDRLLRRARPPSVHEAHVGVGRGLGRRPVAPGPCRVARSCSRTRTHEEHPDARGLHRRRRPHPRRQARRRAVPGAPRRPRRARDHRDRRAHRHRPGRGRGRVLRLRRPARAPGRRHRPHLLARRRVPRGGAGHDDRPPVRVVAAGGALRRAGRDERHQRRDRRRRRPEHEPDPDRGRADRGRAVRVHRPVLGFRGVDRRATATRRSRSSSAPR